MGLAPRVRRRTRRDAHQLGYSPLMTGPSFVPNAAAFGVTGMVWQRLPARLAPAHGSLGLTVAAADAADASGMLTTNVQLAQVLGIATIGSAYLASTITLALLGCAVATGVAAVAAASSAPSGRIRR